MAAARTSGRGKLGSFRRRDSVDRRLQWVIVCLLTVAVVYAVVASRYVYPAVEGAGAGRIRIDRWTGASQIWGCAAYIEGAPKWNAGPLEQSLWKARGADSTGCLRYGWRLRQ